MERTVPMDRLICGDVGYGKTEIAVRAAFKAVQDGKQVAVLVPTTLLCQQHLSHVRRALRLVPGEGGQRSRASAVTPQSRRRRSRGCAAGTVDVVIGTHRLLTSGVRFKDLGLRRHRRGAAFRRRAQGAPQGAAHQRRRARHVGDADPAHPRDGRHRDPRDVGDPDATGGATPRPHLRRPVRRQADRRGDQPRAACARARSSSCTTASSRSTASRGDCRSWSPTPASPWRTAR